MLKTIWIRLLALSGLLKFLRWYNRDRILILCLHSVVDAAKLSWQPLRTAFSVDLLRNQLDVISRYYTWISLDHAVDIVRGKAPPVANGVVLTFDDGYRNNMSVALPELERHSVEPTFYVTTAFLNNRQTYWFERLDYAIQQLQTTEQVRLHGRAFRFVPGNRNSQRAAYAALRNLAKAHFDDDREFYAFFNDVTGRLERATGKALADVQAGDPCSETLSDEDLHVLSESRRTTIGSHTVDHFRLDKVDADVCANQLTESRRYIENATGAPCRHFCYPNGNWNRAVADAVAAAGYDSAVTTRGGFNSAGDDPYTLRRLHMPQTDDENRLLFFLSGFGELKDRLVSSLRIRRQRT
jgi:peptidoglycan/xylan/chitin deacetylase (PgdA/CDA1 family)